MKFIFDENLPRQLAHGLNCFEEDVFHVIDLLEAGITDVELLEFSGKNGYFLITRDKRMRYNKSEILALRRNAVGAFFLIGKTMRMWDIVKQLINSWENIKEITESEHKPFIYTLRNSGKPERYNL